MKFHDYRYDFKNLLKYSQRIVSNGSLSFVYLCLLSEITFGGEINSERLVTNIYKEDQMEPILPFGCWELQPDDRIMFNLLFIDLSA